MHGPSEHSERYRTDCRRCKGLCCIVPAHVPSNGFPAEKPANQRCRHLGAEHRCRIFENLEAEGYRICRAYDCRGAGPLVSSWIDADDALAPETRRLEDFRQLSRLHLLAMAVRHEGNEESGGEENGDGGAEVLFNALDAISIAYKRDGVFTMTEEGRAALRQSEALVGRVLARLGEG
jgi:hypothetical protein